ncbi:hypothetical protein PSEMO_50190 [Pseudomonas putida]|uniref:Uncharacterized protein n=1 Tax=Pseudomonas putida TaxID=303 RepID=A0A1Q9QYC9_PSEPU|nr:hypothetical protein PSEMO_50190 [Pseudomonas putida]
MPPPHQRVDQIPRSPLLHPNLHPPQPLPPRRIQCSLRIQPKIHHIHHHLHMPLGLHIPPHHPKRPERFPVLGQEPRNDRVKGLLPRQKTIGMRRIQTELLPPILQRNPTPRQHHPRPKPVIVALNKRNHIPLGIRRSQINRATGQRIPMQRRLRHLPDLPPPPRRIFITEQIRHRHPHMLRIGDVVQPIAIRQLHRLQLPVPGQLTVPVIEVKPFQDLQRH